jgi:hypothetical protein
MERTRILSIQILEDIAEYLAKNGLAKEDIFDCKNGNTTWYDLEDMVTNIIEQYNNKV